MARVLWRGVVLDERTADMMTEVANMVPGIEVRPTQGSYSSSVGASAGTHGGGGAIDLAVRDLTGRQRDDLVAAMRRVGMAAWLRREWEGPWPVHIHAVAVGCDDLSWTASAQVGSYNAGRNGLANDGPDNGPRDWVGQTWETYKEDPMITDADVDRIAERVWKYVIANQAPKPQRMQKMLRDVWESTTAQTEDDGSD